MKLRAGIKLSTFMFMVTYTKMLRCYKQTSSFWLWIWWFCCFNFSSSLIAAIKKLIRIDYHIFHFSLQQGLPSVFEWQFRSYSFDCANLPQVLPNWLANTLLYFWDSGITLAHSNFKSLSSYLSFKKVKHLLKIKFLFAE